MSELGLCIGRERRSFRALFSVLLSCPSPVPSAIPQPGASGIWRWTYSFLWCCYRSFGLNAFLSYEIAYGVPDSPPPDWCFILNAQYEPLKEARKKELYTVQTPPNSLQPLVLYPQFEKWRQHLLSLNCTGPKSGMSELPLLYFRDTAWISLKPQSPFHPAEHRTTNRLCFLAVLCSPLATWGDWKYCLSILAWADSQITKNHFERIFFINSY